MPTNTTKIADQSPMPKATMASGIHATGAMGASSVTVGQRELAHDPEVEGQAAGADARYEREKEPEEHPAAGWRQSR